MQEVSVKVSDILFWQTVEPTIQVAEPICETVVPIFPLHLPTRRHNLTACKMAGAKNEARRHGTTVVKVPQGAASDGLVDPFDDGRGSSLADAEMASSRPAIDFDGTS
ncbi:hypothetical protein E4U37_002745 [Claviceps purpurea]|nr:hypothetical protein E4U37_002745 [Claviceps purpurea]